MFLKPLCDTLSNHTCLSGLNFKILDTTALGKDLGTFFSAWTWRVTCAWLTKHLLSRNVRVVFVAHSLWLCSSGIWRNITGHVPLKCQEMFTEWYDVVARKHIVIRLKHISSKVAEKNSKYPFPKLHFQDNQIKWIKTWLVYVLNYGLSCEEVPLNIDVKLTVSVRVNRICAFVYWQFWLN